MGSDKCFTLATRSFAPRRCPPRAACIESGRRGYAGLCAVSDVVVSLPASFSAFHRMATRAGELAALKVERLINEPTAAALA